MSAALLMAERNRGGRDAISLGRLTPRQQEILGLLAKGFYYKEIGATLGISHSTVRAHLHSVYRKLEVRSRSRAVIKFHELVEQHSN
jgi:DNA-binding NarL/FixJ family response regulator